MLQVALWGAKARMGRIARVGRVALMGVMMAAAAPLVSSCGDDGGGGSEEDQEGTYTPPADLDSAGIVQLLKDANVALNTAEKATRAKNSTKTGGNVTYKAKEETQLDKVGQKRLNAEYINDLLVEFSYIEEGKMYDFEWDTESISDYFSGKGEKSYALKTLSAEDIKRYFVTVSDNNYIYVDGPKWKVEGDAIVGEETSSTYVFKQEITLNAAKRFKSVKSKYTYSDGSDPEEYFTTFTYDANPTFPSAYSKGDFK